MRLVRKLIKEAVQIAFLAKIFRVSRQIYWRSTCLSLHESHTIVLVGVHDCQQVKEESLKVKVEPGVQEQQSHQQPLKGNHSVPRIQTAPISQAQVFPGSDQLSP